MKCGTWIVAAVSAAATIGCPVRVQAQAVSISIDGTAPGAPLERVWPNHGYDEVNYSTTAEGEALLKTLAEAHTAPVHVRSHFLLNTGNGTPSLKWGSTNVYTEDSAGNPIYSWTLTDGIMDAITGAGAFSFTEIAFMPQALSTGPAPYMNPDPYSFASGAFYPPRDYTKWSNLMLAIVGAIRFRARSGVRTVTQSRNRTSRQGPTVEARHRDKRTAPSRPGTGPLDLPLLLLSPVFGSRREPSATGKSGCSPVVRWPAGIATDGIRRRATTLQPKDRDRREP